MRSLVFFDQEWPMSRTVVPLTVLLKQRKKKLEATSRAALKPAYPLSPLGDALAEPAVPGEAYAAPLPELDTEGVRVLAMKAGQQLSTEAVAIANSKAIGILSLFREGRKTGDIDLM